MEIFKALLKDKISLHVIKDIVKIVRIFSITLISVLNKPLIAITGKYGEHKAGLKVKGKK